MEFVVDAWRAASQRLNLEMEITPTSLNWGVAVFRSFLRLHICRSPIAALFAWGAHNQNEANRRAHLWLQNRPE
jgi:hypothetical protein